MFASQEGRPQAAARRRFLSSLLYWLAVLAAVFWPATFPHEELGLGLLLFVFGCASVAFVLGRAADREELEPLLRLSYQDELTGLANRRAFIRELRSCLSKPAGRSDSLAIFFMDFDRFKSINDSFGHSTGDRLLQAISSRLQQCTPHGGMLARFGGDEFTLLLSGVKAQEEVLKLGKDILAVFDHSIKVYGQDVWASASMGIAVVGTPWPRLEDILSMADTALYNAKAQGKGRLVLFEPNLPRPTQWATLDADLRSALYRSELVLHFQPVVALSSLRIVGFEALIRWNHPRFGLLSPHDFIPVAEESGIIRSLGSWVIESACQRTRAWQSLYGETLTISINLSALQFRQRDMLAHISGIASRAGLKPGAIQLEITESILMQDDDQTLRNLTELRRQGFKIAIDDFGVGYSSLSYLKRFEVDALKIDQSFLSDVTNERAEALVRGTIQLGHSLGMVVVAEGIETEEQMAFMKRAGCDLAQGFLLGKPMDERQLNDLLSRNGLQAQTPGGPQDPGPESAPHPPGLASVEAGWS